MSIREQIEKLQATPCGTCGHPYSVHQHPVRPENQKYARCLFSSNAGKFTCRKCKGFVDAEETLLGENTP